MHTKRIAVGEGKKPVWITTPLPGSHERKRCIPLLSIIRDMLGYADNAREAKKIISEGLILVDKKKVKKPRVGVGLMDVIEIPKLEEYYRIVPVKKGLTLKEIEKDEAQVKPCKIKNKTTVQDGETQITLHDGKNLIIDNQDYSPRDTVILQLENWEIKKHLPLKEDNLALVVYGKHSGDIEKIKEIREGSAIHRSLTKLEGFQTRTAYIFVIGQDKPVISL